MIHSCIPGSPFLEYFAPGVCSAGDWDAQCWRDLLAAQKRSRWEGRCREGGKVFIFDIAPGDIVGKRHFERYATREEMGLPPIVQPKPPPSGVPMLWLMLLILAVRA